MGNRWWALGFVVFVCWQAVDYVSDAPGSTSHASTDANTDAADARALDDALKAM